MRRFLSLLPCLVLLACSEFGPPPESPLEPLVRVSFPRGGVINVIRIEAPDRLPLRAAALVAPDGTMTQASALEAAPSPQVRRGQQTQRAPWLSSQFDGENIGSPTAPVAAFRSDTQLLVILSTAEITVPDPVAYRRDWAGYKIRLSFDAGGGQIETRDIAAPAPPPG